MGGLDIEVSRKRNGKLSLSFSVLVSYGVSYVEDSSYF